MALWISFKAKVGDDGDTEDDIKTAFQEYDVDHDGYITKDEMVEVGNCSDSLMVMNPSLYIIQIAIQIKPNLLIYLQAIERMGFVSNKEEEANKCLKEMDLDGDGRVSFAEFMVKWKVT